MQRKRQALTEVVYYAFADVIAARAPEPGTDEHSKLGGIDYMSTTRSYCSEYLRTCVR